MKGHKHYQNWPEFFIKVKNSLRWFESAWVFSKIPNKPESPFSSEHLKKFSLPFVFSKTEVFRVFYILLVQREHSKSVHTNHNIDTLLGKIQPEWPKTRLRKQILREIIKKVKS